MKRSCRAGRAYSSGKQLRMILTIKTNMQLSTFKLAAQCKRHMYGCGREAALGFLGLHGVNSSTCQPSGVCGAENLMSDSVKVHPGGCRTKIANWAQVRESLQGTDTFVACESQQW